MPSGRDNFRRNRVAPLGDSILPSASMADKIPASSPQKRTRQTVPIDQVPTNAFPDSFQIGGNPTLNSPFITIKASTVSCIIVTTVSFMVGSDYESTCK